MRIGGASCTPDITQRLWGWCPLWVARAEPRARGNFGVNTRGKEARGKTAVTMSKKLIGGRNHLGTRALGPEAQYSCGRWHGELGVAAGKALSLIPGGPTDCQR
jgi:hypothetical protein